MKLPIKSAKDILKKLGQVICVVKVQWGKKVRISAKNYILKQRELPETPINVISTGDLITEMIYR